MYSMGAHLSAEGAGGLRRVAFLRDDIVLARRRAEGVVLTCVRLHFSICACHPCAGAMLIFSVSFQV